MNYEILDHVRYYKTKQEEKNEQTIITFNAYENLDGIMVSPKLPNRKGIKNITVRINQKESPFPTIPYRTEKQEDFIQKILNLENLHVQVGFSMQKELKTTLIKMFLHHLKRHYLFSTELINHKEQGMNLLLQFTEEVIQPLFPSFFQGRKVQVYPLVIPARLQQNEMKKEDKYFFYQRYIKRLQRYYQAKQVIYLECPDFGYGLLLFPLTASNGEKTLLYHDPNRFVKDSQRKYPTFFHSNVTLIDMNAYYKYFGFKPIHIDVELKGGAF